MNTKRELIYQGRVIRLIKETFYVGNQRLVREVILHPGAAVIVPLLEDQRVVMVRQYRRAAGRRLLELPAGTLTPREPPVRCARHWPRSAPARSATPNRSSACGRWSGSSPASVDLREACGLSQANSMAAQRARWDARAVRALIEGRQITIRKAEPALTRRLAEDFRLEAGEASTLALTKVQGGIMATDDGVAIKACRVVGVPFVTALHMLLEAHERRMVDRSMALVKLEQLQKVGRYHPRILEEAMGRLMRGGQAS